MAYNDFGFKTALETQANGGETILFKAGEASSIKLPDSSYIRDAEILRDGMDLVLKADHGQVTLEHYFSGENQPTLTGPDSAVLTPDLVNSFVKSGQEYASNLSATDESPVGQVDELSGEATVTRTDGSIETIHMGTEIYQGDIIETAGNGAVNITFSDDSSFAVSEDARIAIDEYVFDPSTESGAQDFSVLKGVFVYTSGLIGRDDPDDVNIETPVGSIGIRGTIIAGDVDQGEITVVEGAIVLRDFDGNEVTLANQFETAKFNLDGTGIKHIGELSANDVAGKFSAVSDVAPTLFSSINDAAAEHNQTNTSGNKDVKGEETVEQEIQETEAKEEAVTEETKTEVSEAEDTKAEDADTESETKETSGEESETGEAVQVDTNPETKTIINAEAKSEPAEQPAIQKIITKIADLKGAEIQKPAAQHKPEVVREKAAEYVERKIADLLGESSINGDHSALPDDYGFIAKQGTNADPSKVFVLRLDELFDGDRDGAIFELGSDTIALLDNLAGSTLDTADTSSGSAVSLGNGQGWGFNPATGELVLYINEQADFEAADIALNIRAKNPGEKWSDFETLTLKAYDADSSSNAGILSTDQYNDGEVVFYDATNGKITGNSDTTIFAKDGSGHLDLDVLNNATIFTGEGTKEVTIKETSSGNTIIGGDNVNADNKFYVKNVDNDIHAMGGDDEVKIYLDQIGNGNSAGIGGKIDGGVGGHDTLILFDSNGGDTVNFGDIDTAVTNFETIQLWNTDSTSNLKIEQLALEDVVALTGEQNILTIDDHSGLGNTTVELDGDWTSHGDTDGDGYAEYTGTAGSGENVTLLVDTDVAVI